MKGQSDESGHQRLAQDLIADPIAHGLLITALLHGGQAADTTSALIWTRSSTTGPFQTRQSLPDPHDDSLSSTGAPT